MVKKEEAVNSVLKVYLENKNRFSRGLSNFMQHSVLGRGKRLRSILVLEVAEMFSKDWRRFLPCACGIEMVHTSSLILDDLPCMDDALTRRGKPALHRVAGEANAILASYALLMEGIRLIAQNAADFQLDSQRFSQIIESITEAVGLEGISAGQFLDLRLSGVRHSLSDIKRIHSYKTASLFVSALEITAVLAKANKRQISSLKEYGRNLGLAFQLRDDLLDKEKKAKDLGKSSLKGEKRPNYTRIAGIDKSRTELDCLVKRTISALGIFGAKAKKLQGIANFVKERMK